MPTPLRVFHYLLVLLLASGATGCKRHGIDLPTAPVSGKIVYQGKPLGFGRVIFFHPSGHAAGAELSPDGTFKLTAYQGSNAVAVECLDVDRPGSGKVRLRTGGDKSLIPDRYANYSISGLTLDVKPGEKNNVEFTLKD
jgi:hypothetical protein